MAAAVTAAAAAAAARKKRVLGSFGISVKTSPEQFLDILKLDPQALVLRRDCLTVFRAKHDHWRYVTVVRGFLFFCEPEEELAITNLVIDTDDELKVPQDM